MSEVKNEQDMYCFEETMKHRAMVHKILSEMANELKRRGRNHDQSKMEDPEFPLFSEWTPKLSSLSYGSEEYTNALKSLKPALDHHYANNRHHSEHFKNGIRDMNLVDIMEMFVDWYCASKRHADGNIRKSIDINKERYKFSDDLAQIFVNSIELLDK